MKPWETRDFAVGIYRHFDPCLVSFLFPLPLRLSSMPAISVLHSGSARMEADDMMLWKRFALSDELSPSIGIASVAIQCILYGGLNFKSTESKC